MTNTKEKRVITEKMIMQYRTYMCMEEKSKNTVEKYCRDLRKLMQYAQGREITKELMIGYKQMLLESGKYKITSINSFIVAANRFFYYMEWYGLSVKTINIQSEVCCPKNKELTINEYKTLVKTAKKSGKHRLAMIITTMCAVGIRVSELSAITASGVKKGEVMVHNKGKMRRVLIPEMLKKELMMYMARANIKDGYVFCTSSGKNMSRMNIWRDMKALCDEARVESDKVFPHNLRHLFAKTYYGMKKDIAMLAAIMGHSNIETTRCYLKYSAVEYLKELDTLGLVV